MYTDDEGRYAFGDLPGGRYTLTAGRVGYVTTELAEPIVLGDGESRGRVDVRLPRGGVLAVSVADERGDPIVATITAWSERPNSTQLDPPFPFFTPTSTRTLERFTGRTDEHGRGLISALPAGTYYVMATRGSPRYDAEPAIEYPADNFPRRLTYVPTLYPGTTAIDEARPATVDVGGETTIQMIIRSRPADPPGTWVVSSHGPPPAAPIDPASRGRVRGRVLAANGSGPLVRALVTLDQVPERDGGNRRTLTDEQGRFEFKTVPDGGYSVSASAPGFLTRAHGQAPNHFGIQAIHVETGTVPDVEIALERASAIAVRITDDTGNPRAGVEVQVLKRHRYKGESYLWPAAIRSDAWQAPVPTTIRTDEGGEARMHGLPPGKYWLSACVCRENARLMEPPDAARHRHRRLIYATTLFPGVTAMNLAQPVDLAAGQELTVGISLGTVRTARVSGRVRDARGNPGHGKVIISSEVVPGARETVFGMELSDGRFAFPHVPPRRYVIETERDDDESAGTEYGSLPIVVGDDDLDALLLTTHLPGVIRGHIVFDTGAPPTDLTPADALGVITGVANPGTLEIHDDWTFTATGMIEPAMLWISAGDDSEWQLGTITRRGGCDLPPDPRR